MQHFFLIDFLRNDTQCPIIKTVMQQKRWYLSYAIAYILYQDYNKKINYDLCQTEIGN